MFWKDHWDGSDTFQAKYPELFSFARDKDAQVANYMECLHGKVIWKSVFIQQAQDWELESMARFLDNLYAV